MNVELISTKKAGVGVFFVTVSFLENGEESGILIKRILVGKDAKDGHVWAKPPSQVVMTSDLFNEMLRVLEKCIDFTL